MNTEPRMGDGGSGIAIAPTGLRNAREHRTGGSLALTASRRASTQYAFGIYPHPSLAQNRPHSRPGPLQIARSAKNCYSFRLNRPWQSVRNKRRGLDKPIGPGQYMLPLPVQGGFLVVALATGYWLPATGYQPAGRIR